MLAAIFGVIWLTLPSRPDGSVDTIELGEVEKFTEVELEDRLIGDFRGNILVSWGDPDASSEGKNEDTEDTYYLVDCDKYSSITLCYDTNEVIKSIVVAIRNDL